MSKIPQTRNPEQRPAPVASRAPATGHVTLLPGEHAAPVHADAPVGTVSRSHTVRRLSLRAQLALFSVALVLIAAGGSSFAGWQIVESLLEQSASDRLDVASAAFASLYQQRVADAEIVTRQLSERTLLASRIAQGNAERIASLIEPIQTLRPAYSIVVADQQLNVLAKAIPPGRGDPGATLAEVPGAAEALEAVETSAALLRRPDCQLVIAASVPIKDNRQSVVGIMHLRVPLDESFVQQVKDDMGLDVSLYCGDTVIASTLPGTSRVAHVGPAVIENVLNRGQIWEEDTHLRGQTYRTRYVPLLDIQGDPAGMYAVSIPVQTLRDARYAILRYFLPVTAAIVAVALGLAYWGSSALTRPIRRLAAAAAAIGNGDLATPVAVESKDEVARLAEQMEEMRRSLLQTYTHLRHLNELKEEYLFSVAHEVRTPLSSLVASVEILATDYKRMDPEQLAGTVQRIERAAVRLHTLVENVLDAGSLRAGKFTIHPSSVRLDEVFDAALATIQPLLDEKHQSVVLDLRADAPPVHGDERRIAQVFANLLSNASKYGPAGDLIRVNARYSQDVVTVTISDSGPGIPLPEQGELFERYFRSSSSARTSPGTGLGLAITKAIVEAHGGTVGLESDPGTGTAVWFTLPLRNSPLSQPRNSATVSAG